MQFSFIVLYRNRDMARVERCLQSIENQLVTVETFVIDVRALREGIYFLRVVDGEKIMVKKIVK